MSADERQRDEWLARERARDQAEADEGNNSKWPDPMAEEALYGLAGDVVNAIAPTTEADPAALLLQFFTFFGNAAGRNPHFMVEDTRHGINEYVALVGSTSKARKGTSEKRIRNLYKRAIPDFVGRIRSGLSSGEGLIWAIRDPIIKTNPKTGESVIEDSGEPDKRLLIVESELATALRRIDRDGSSLSPILRDAWDGSPLDTLVSERSKPKARAEESHVSVVGHITVEELTRYLSRTEMANGLGNRFLVACVRRAQSLPFGGREPKGLNELVLRLRKAIEWAWEVPEITMDGAAQHIWVAIYAPLSDGKLGLRGAMLARAEAHVRRIAAIYAVLDLAPEVRKEHLFAALAVWDYVEASVRYVFRDAALGDPDADDVLDAVRATGSNGMTRVELRDHFGRNWSSGRLDAAVSLLEERSLLFRTQEPSSGPGRPATRYRVAGSALIELPRSYLQLARNV